VLYPGFAAALAEQRKKAEDAMTAAKAVSDPEASAKQMAQANSLLTGGFVSTLGELDGKTKTLREKLVTASTEAEHASDQAGAKAATDDAQRILKNVDEQLKTGAPDAIAAAVLVRKIDGDISSATSNLNRVIDASTKRKQAATKPAAAAPGGPNAPAPAPPPKVTWKCTYCGHVNDDSAKKCPNCGAPRPDPNAAPKKKK
jgi:rubrerythrin